MNDTPSPFDAYKTTPPEPNFDLLDGKFKTVQDNDTPQTVDLAQGNGNDTPDLDEQILEIIGPEEYNDKASSFNQAEAIRHLIHGEVVRELEAVNKFYWKKSLPEAAMAMSSYISDRLNQLRATKENQ